MPEPNAEYVTRLGDMGFPEPVARRALLLTRNRLDAATEWCAGKHSFHILLFASSLISAQRRQSGDPVCIFVQTDSIMSKTMS